MTPAWRIDVHHVPAQFMCAVLDITADAWRYLAALPLADAPDCCCQEHARPSGPAEPHLRGIQEHVDDHDCVDGAAGAKSPRVTIDSCVAVVRWQLCSQQHMSVMVQW